MPCNLRWSSPSSAEPFPQGSPLARRRWRPIAWHNHGTALTQYWNYICYNEWAQAKSMPSQMASAHAVTFDGDILACCPFPSFSHIGAPVWHTWRVMPVCLQHLEEAARYGIQTNVSEAFECACSKLRMPMSTHVYTFNNEVEHRALDKQCPDVQGDAKGAI